MFVPGHVVSMYVATGGASGLSLGSDEKEIILLVFAIIDVVTNKVSLEIFYFNLQFTLWYESEFRVCKFDS